MSSIFLIIITVALQITTAFGHGCYVCTPSNDHKRDVVLEELKASFLGIKIRKCNEFHRSIRDEFILECPKDHFGCLTVFEENSVTRRCAKPSINDCQVANGITYCYCKNDACNNPDRKLDDPAPDQLLSAPNNQKTHKHNKGRQPSTEKLISIGTGFSDDEDIQVVNKNRRIVHHSGRPENDEEDEEGSGDYYGELYYSESDESYPEDYSDTTDRTDTEDLIIEETHYDKNLLSQNVDKSRLDEINFDDEYEGRRKDIKPSVITDDDSPPKTPKTNGAADSTFLQSMTSCLSTLILTVLILSLQ